MWIKPGAQAQAAFGRSFPLQEAVRSRREFLKCASGCLAAGGLGLFSRLSMAAALHDGAPLAPRPAHAPPQAKQLLFVFLTGGFSHLDTFDPKPKLAEMHGKPIPAFGLRADEARTLPLLRSPFAFRQCGQSGLWLSDLFPRLGDVADELCVIRTLHTDIVEHFQATLAMHTGSSTIPLPSIGAWLSYALGTLNPNLPPFVVLAEHLPYAGAQVWDSNFLPPHHQGVRVVELIDTGSHDNWDAHGDMAAHRPKAQRVDQPLAALLHDLRHRGLLTETLVVICTEFGRTPWSDSGNGKGRNHYAKAFSCLLAGAGVRAGMAYGETDEFGANIVANPVHVHDYHATILHLMGLDHTRLTYRYGGRDFRLTDVAGNVVREILA